MLKLIAIADFALTIATSAQGMTPAPLAPPDDIGDTSGRRMWPGQDQNQRCMRRADDRTPDSPRRPQMRAMAGRRLRPIVSREAARRQESPRYRRSVVKGPGGCGRFCTGGVSPPTSLRSVSLLQADWPERVLQPTGLGILRQRKPGCLAALCTGKFLGRYGGAIYGPRRAS